MAAAKSQQPPRVLDPEVPERDDPFAPKRDTFPLEMDRIQSGGLKDDPTESGAPVRDRRSYTNLTGGGK